MYDLTWQNEALWREQKGGAPIAPAPDDRPVSSAALLLWEEHCVECSMPECYSTCRLYVARPDQKCARFVYGVFPNPEVRGLFDYGADILFRRWGKLEAQYSGTPRMMPVNAVRRYARWGRRFEQVASAAGDVLQPISPRRRVNGLNTLVRAKWLDRQSVAPAPAPTADAFYVKFFHPGDDEFDLQVEFHQDRPISRDVIRVKPGWNEKVIPLDEMIGADPHTKGRILLALSNEEVARLVFTWLDLVCFQQPVDVHPDARPSATSTVPEIKPAAKVKCVAWDLDNTLWTGVIGDAGAENVVPNERALALVKQLDERGILQTVASKNTYEVAWAKIEALGLADYFLFPAIHWGPKSESLKSVATELNINVDTFALVDDSEFEREEVSSSLPQVRVYDVTEIERLLQAPEFDVPITEASAKRRLSYLTEAKRKRVGAVWKGDYDSFLRSCGLVMHIERPEGGARLRCLELVQRTNQLNLSTRRYSDAEFAELFESPAFDCFAIRCADKFGDYGLVGFAVIDRSGEAPTLRDFVLSCRVAQKKVEETFIYWYARRVQELGSDRLRATFTATDRNKPLREALRAVPFEVVGQTANSELLELPLQAPVSIPDVIQIEEG